MFLCLWENCEQEWTTLEALITHVRNDHVAQGKKFYVCRWKNCRRNQKPFIKRHKMYNHFRTHTGEKPFQCDDEGCQRRFSRLDSLVTHKKVHSNIRPFQCKVPDCTKAYFHARSLRKHLRCHTVPSG
ncbi:Gli-3 product/segment polarity gene cubitus interruptus-like protein [Halteromyces radiatus]|uniref:Gli-3 product/segment polarity gene cubitus interruptus-like protein n=1 Tax=Halteromyces radiatus TaxID=101107 RepID=UPI00221F9B55|nr:Gli-3 product/segment polarity gene cubitus interruptus-like protein [Halteromyces radiatus]KAI8093168.1 Gli-3 product/segment polarity gene cubitus interruptus-like protein [Halteromyces radiatus]